MLTKKDIIAMNQQFDQGHFDNESSLDYALEMQKHSIAWSKKAAYLVRAILIDHVFEEGNKRTALTALLYLASEEGYKVEQKKAVQLVKDVVVHNITSIRKIRELIENGLVKKD